MSRDTKDTKDKCTADTRDTADTMHTTDIRDTRKTANTRDTKETREHWGHCTTFHYSINWITKLIEYLTSFFSIIGPNLATSLVVKLSIETNTTQSVHT